MFYGYNTTPEEKARQDAIVSQVTADFKAELQLLIALTKQGSMVFTIIVKLYVLIFQSTLALTFRSMNL